MLGGVLYSGSSKLLSGPLGVCKVGFNGYDLGKTGADTTLSPDQDIKDIMYQQDGTKAADHVRTGMDVLLSVTFSEINTGLIKQLMAGFESSEPAGSDGAVFDRNLYQSMRDNEAKVLKVASVNANGVASELDEDIFCFYEAIPIISGELINWGADTQRNLPVDFRIKWHTFSTGESTTYDGAFGYYGDPTVEDVPAIVWPDVEAPEISSATADSATNIDVVFDENIAFVNGSFDVGSIAATVDDIFVLATAASISSATLSITFPASSFTSSDVIELYIADNEIEDTESTPNVFPGTSAHAVTNSVT